MTTNRQITLAKRPEGVPKADDFKLVEGERPEPAEGEFLVRTNYLSVDPYMRGLISGRKSYMEPVEIGGLMPGGTVGAVVASRNAKFKEGDVVSGYWGWQEYAVQDGRGAMRFDTSLAPMSTSLGVLGMPGLTAYFGLLDIGQPKEGDMVFVSGGAGAVGSLVGQIAHIKGCKVAGSAGSDEKTVFMRNECRFDQAFNYKEVDDYGAKLKEICPGGVDVYFDNVGGPLTDAVFDRINMGARIVVCGQIDQYNNMKEEQGPRKLSQLILKCARAEGFLIFQFQDKWKDGIVQMAEWLKEGKLTYRETVVDGIEHAPDAFIGLFRGDNIGKQLVRVAKEG